ncbi:MAG: PEGA domain-containing protein [Candidatus Uhrbacteria bacterium]|nr:PEGA domain-containing protein [Candidatus Uhrbacteria bacterium]
MSRFWRTILFAVFAIGFLISAPLVVFYTAGYRYQFGSMHIVKAGVLSVTSLPKGATVLLNGVLSDKKTPAVIDNVLPGDIKIRIEKSGYSSWEKALPILSGQSTFVPNAVLFLDGAPVQAIDQTMVVSVTVQSPSRYAYLVNNKGTLEAWIKDDALTQTQPILTQPFHAKSAYALSWSRDGGYLLLTETTFKKTETIIRAHDGIIIPLPVVTLADAWWNTDSGHTLFYKTGTEIHAFGIDADVSFPKKIVADDADMKQGKMLVVQSGEQSVVSELNDIGIATILAYLPHGTYQFVHSPDSLIMLQDVSRNHLVLIDPTQKNSLLLNEEAQYFEWSPKEDRLIFSNGFDVNLFTTQTDQVETLTRFSEPLTDLAWYPLGDEILYSKNGVLNALELDKRDKRNEIPLVTGYNIQSMWSNKDGASLFFYGQKGNDPATIFERILQK